MLQRIQTIFLFLITLFSVLQLFVPFQTISTYENTLQLYLSPTKYNEATQAIIHLPLIICILITILSVVAIFLYKKRSVQMKLCTLIALISLCLTASLFLFTYAKLDDKHETIISYHAAAFIPLINIVLAFIAKRFIKRDDELVKSADRIR